MRRDKLVEFLDAQFEDLGDEDAPNGLQFTGKDEVKKVALAVDARLATIQKAAKMGADMLFTHHPLIFDPMKRVGIFEKARLKALIENDLNLYSQHLPLDKHPKLGNNALIAKALGLKIVGGFASHHGFPIGVAAIAGISFDELVRRVRKSIGDCITIKTHEGTGKIGIVSGAGGKASSEVEAGGTFITGDPNGFVEARANEMGFNVIFAGHYRTEVFGVKAVGKELEKLGLKVEFIDCPTRTG